MSVGTFCACKENVLRSDNRKINLIRQFFAVKKHSLKLLKREVE
jgi:hypothetical protein